MIRVEKVTIYPVKSLKGISLHQVFLDRQGLQWDRRWLVVDDRINSLTQRELLRMALIETWLSGSHLHLRANGSEVRVLLFGLPEKRGQVTVSKKNLFLANDQGDEVARWLSDFLGVSCRLVRLIEEESPKALHDLRPILLISQASLDDLNSRLKSPLPMNRFRPNIIVSGAGTYGEDDWSALTVGQVKLGDSQDCYRCPITTINQETSEKSKEPLATLGRYRRTKQGVRFGKYFTPQQTVGAIYVGDKVVPI